MFIFLREWLFLRVRFWIEIYQVENRMVGFAVMMFKPILEHHIRRVREMHLDYVKES